MLRQISHSSPQKKTVYETIFNPQYVDQFSRKPRVIPWFGICVKKSLEEFNSNTVSIAMFQFPETPPWTYRTVIVNLTLSNAKDQADPYKFVYTI